MKTKKWIGQAAGVFLMVTAGILYSCRAQPGGEELGLAPATAPEAASAAEMEETSEAAWIYVHVCGAVQAPGVYQLPAGSRYQDAVQAAGGFAEDAEETFLNLASPLTDGEQLVVPTVEEAASRAEEQRQEEAADSRVDINRAGKEELMTLPGIGEVRAEAILAYREEHGPFSSPEDIMQVSGIKESTFEKLKERIKVGISDGE